MAVLLATAFWGSLGWRLLPREVMPDFSTWPAGEARKEQFFAFLRPLLEAENARVLSQRARLERLAAAPQSAGWLDRRWLAALAREYRLDPELTSTDGRIRELLVRVDAVPVSLGLAQAATESGWGTSRFAVEGYALFGQRCFDPGCGLVPEARTEGLSHEVQAFASPQDSVAGYIQNLNSHPDYQSFRTLRADLRAAGVRVTGYVLARALHRYSERRDSYIEDVRQMIRHNDLGPVPVQ